jgi:Cu/Ag efflux pump CusA
MSNGVRVESRQVVLDVEIPGQAPYEVTTNVLVPLNLRADVMPGATVELRVDPKNNRTIAIVGPGSGFQVMGLLTQPGKL